MDVVVEALRRVSLFASIPPEEIARLAKRSQHVRCAANTLILNEQDVTRDVFFVIEGLVRVTAFSEAGREVCYRNLRGGEMFGELSAIDGKSRSATVIAIHDSTLVRMSADAFAEALTRHPDVAMVMLCRLVGLIRALSERVFEFSTLNVSGRIRVELLRVAREHGVIKNGRSVISPPPKHADLASRVSTHREAVTRQINELARAGLIERTRGALIIADVERFARLIKDESY